MISFFNIFFVQGGAQIVDEDTIYIEELQLFQTKDIVIDGNMDDILEWDPVSGGWKVFGKMKKKRIYHAISSFLNLSEFFNINFGLLNVND